MIKQFFELTKQYESEYGAKSIVFYQCGAFFECYGLKTEKDVIFGSNIVDFGRICDLAVVDKKVCVGSNPVVMAGFKDHYLEKYVKKMQDNHYTIIVYEQDHPGANTTRSLTGIYSPGTYFSLDTQNITNNTCCIWLELKKPTIKSLNKHIYVGFSQIDIYSGKTSIMEYNELYINSPTTFDKLEHFISIYNPCETIFVYNGLSKKEVDDIMSYIVIRSKLYHFVSLSDTGICVERALNCEKQIYQTQLLTQFYKVDDIQSFMDTYNNYVYATQSFCYLLDFMYQHNPNLVKKVSEPSIEVDHSRLILANHSLKQLNIIDDDNYSGKYSSVVKMLNECITPMGKRQFTYQFLNPITNIQQLQQEYNITSYLLDNPELYVSLRGQMTSIKDIIKINRQIILKKISPKMIYQLHNSLMIIQGIHVNITSSSDPFVSYIKQKIPCFEEISNDIQTSIDFIENKFVLDNCINTDKIDSCIIQHGVDQILDSKTKCLMDAEDQLNACRKYLSGLISKYEKKPSTTRTTKKKTTNKSKIADDDNDNHDDVENTSEESEIMEEQSYVKYETTESYNVSLMATDRRCKILDEIIKKQNNQSVLLSYNSSYLSGEEQTFRLFLNSPEGQGKLEYIKQKTSNCVIVSSQISKMCKDIYSIKSELKELITKVYTDIITSISQYNEQIERIGLFITHIDLICSKAFLANKYHYCKPDIVSSDKSFVNATGLRHCLIENIQDTEIYVANDISIGKTDKSTDNKSDKSLTNMDGMLLYGTNAVGKTSFIRSLGISVIMAQSGLFVPATTFQFSPYKYIFTRILGNDNLFKGLSTFAVEMSELRTILKLADKNSLVLGDELCSGTESISAVSIFVSGIQALAKRNTSFIFATHLHEIIDYDEITCLKNVHLKHMSVIYDREHECLVYDRKLKDGPGNNMYGLEVCKSLNLPTDFLENAHNIRMKYHPTSSSLLGRSTSHFNAKHIKGTCEKCGVKMGTEVHHLAHQQDADVNGIIQMEDGTTFHKNHPANLINLCEKCHDEFHKTGVKPVKKKTTKGTILK